MTTFTYTDPDGHVLRISPHPGTQAEVLLTIQGPDDGLMVGASIPANEATPVIAAIRAVAHQHDEPTPATDEQARQQIAAEIRQYCPDHGTADTCRMDCHCAIADELTRPAAVSGA